MLTSTALRKASSSMSGSGKSLILFGATGYVGSNIGEIAHSRGWHVIATSRSGGPSKGSRLETLPWAQEATWAKLDANDRGDVYAFLEDVAGGRTATGSSSSPPPVTALVNAIGVLSLDQAIARRDNSSSVANAVAALHDGKGPASLKQFVYVSAADVAFAKPVLHGYFYGKRESEKTLQQHLPSTVHHTILRPGFIYGSRYVTSSSVPIPLALAGVPMEMVVAPISHFFPRVTPAPAISVTNVAKATVYSSEAGASPELGKSGVYEYAGIKDLAKRLI